jgi:hypothetical protein
MKYSLNRHQTGAVIPRVAVAAAMLVSGVAFARPALFPSTHAGAIPFALASSVKPDYRGADLGNSGVLSTSGPAAGPLNNVYNVASTVGKYTGLEQDAAGNIIAYATDFSGVYSYKPDGSLNWNAHAGFSTGAGPAASGNYSNPVLSSDGAVYAGSDSPSDNLYQISGAFASGTTAPVVDIFDDPGNQIQSTPKIGPNNTIYFGDGSAGSGGNIQAITPPAPGAAVTPNSAVSLWSFPSAPAKQTAGTFINITGKNGFFSSEVALETTAGAVSGVYAADAETNGSNGNAISLGTLYKIDNTGTLIWKKPLLNAVDAPVVLNAAQTILIVADNGGNVYAFGPTGTLLWQKSVGSGVFAAPALSPSGTTVYIANAAGVSAFDMATGNVATGWNGGVNPVAVGANGTGAPITVDHNGNLWFEDSASALWALTPAGAPLQGANPVVPSGTGAGNFSGSTNPGDAAVLIDNSGIVYVAGNTGNIRGFANTAAATATAAAQLTATTAAQQTATANASANNTATAVAQATATAAAQQTATANAAANNTATAVAALTATVAANQTATAAAQQTATAAAQQTAAAANATSTAIAGQTATAVAQLTQVAANQTATAQAAGGIAPNCVLIVLPNPKIIQVGGSEAILFKALPNTTITANINVLAPASGLLATYPTTALLYNGLPNTPGVVINGTGPTAAGWTFTFSTGSNGRALLDFPIPQNAQIAAAQVSATANKVNCRANGGPLTRTAGFTVEPAQASSFTQSLHEFPKHALIRSVEAPPAKGSIVTDKLRVVTSANANVGLVVTTGKSSNPHASGLEPAFATGTVIGTYNTNANAKGIATFTFPISSTLLIPGQGAIIIKKVTIQAPGSASTSTLSTEAAIRETRLRLVLQPQESTRGNQREVFVIGKAHATNTNSVLTVLVVADAGASESGQLVIGGNTINAGPVVAGPGGRAKLKFTVPDSTTPLTGSAKATLTVTSTFRGATVTRTLTVTYQHKPA